jgi:hypothetical protein
MLAQGFLRCLGKHETAGKADGLVPPDRARGVRSVPALSGADGEGHGRQERQRSSEARQDRLHFMTPFESVDASLPRQPGGLRDEKIPGFASSPRDEFALDDGAAETCRSRHPRSVRRRSFSMARQYRLRHPREGVAASHRPVATPIAGPRPCPRRESKRPPGSGGRLGLRGSPRDPERQNQRCPVFGPIDSSTVSPSATTSRSTKMFMVRTTECQRQGSGPSSPAAPAPW